MQLTILDGSTFCICDEFAGICGGAAGFYVQDLRYLSLLRVTVDGEQPLLLTSGRPENFMAAFYLRNPVGSLPPDALTLVHRRFVVGDALQDQLVVENVSHEAVAADLRVELGSDFADIITVKQHDFSLGDPAEAPPLPPLRNVRWADGEREGRIEDDEGASTRIVLSVPGAVGEGGARYRVELEPGERWEVMLDVFASTARGLTAPTQQDERFPDEVACARDSLSAWNLRMPQIRTSRKPIGSSFERSIADLATLRMRSRDGGGRLPAAGAPWFMTVFGRDTIVTCLQTLLLGTDLGRAALETLAALQASEDEPSIDAEPGKIIHEIRHGKAARHWFERYYGTVDATPLYLVLLSEVWRWTDDWALVDRLREPALAALRWIDEHGDRDGDGFVEYERRTPRGLRNQSWKDSDDSQCFRDGRLAEPPIAPGEAQGYVFDAKLRIAEVARDAWRDRKLAERLEREAAELARRFDEAYWVADRECYALALDRDKRQVDALCSNIGHLLWSGIVPPERVEPVVDHLVGPGLWSGWGVRTMASSDGGYSPLSYHNGTVWPHDNSLIAAGLARVGRWDEAHRVVRAMFEASEHFDWQLPEVFSGLPRLDSPFPVRYPSAARPQAWAAGTPILLLQVLLGVRPDRRRQTLESVAPAELPAWAGELRLTGVPAFDRLWDITLERGRVRIERG